jgi:hypothetical protein
LKPRHITAERTHAREMLHGCGIAIGADFHTLRSDHVDVLLRLADSVRYQKPRRANGSRARYFHDMLQRRAK